MSTVESVGSEVRNLYDSRGRHLAFHGIHHIDFVVAVASRLAAQVNADVETVGIAAWVHDLNHLIEPASGVERGNLLRAEVLSRVGMSKARITEIEDVVVSASTENRGVYLSLEASVLSDADTLYKVLPITPILLTSLYLRETGASLEDMASKILDEQLPLMQDGILFYNKQMREKYTEWARTNLELWGCLRDSLSDPLVAELLYRVM